MAWLPNPIACDVCGVVKQPSNNWYYAEIAPQDPGEDNPGFAIFPWDYQAEDRTKPYVHLCGQVCAARKLNEFLNPQPPRSCMPEPSTVVEPQAINEPEPSQPQWTEGGIMSESEERK